MGTRPQKHSLKARPSPARPLVTGFFVQLLNLPACALNRRRTVFRIRGAGSVVVCRRASGGRDAEQDVTGLAVDFFKQALAGQGLAAWLNTLQTGGLPARHRPSNRHTLKNPHAWTPNGYHPGNLINLTHLKSTHIWPTANPQRARPHPPQQCQPKRQGDKATGTIRPVDRADLAVRKGCGGRRFPDQTRSTRWCLVSGHCSIAGSGLGAPSGVVRRGEPKACALRTDRHHSARAFPGSPPLVEMPLPRTAQQHFGSLEP